MHMRRIVFLTIFFLVFSIIVGMYFWNRDDMVVSEVTQPPGISATPLPSADHVILKTPPQSYTLAPSRFIAQSFNNCGPATLSMVMSMFGTNIDQETLADRMRPFHNPQGGVDDKSIFAPEFVMYGKEYGFESLERPNGDIALLKQFIANDIPVVVRTWLHPNEDIGHFRIVRGYDDTTQTILQDDSYEGPNRIYAYDTFLSMWQPFNYGYILVYPKEKQAVVDAILREEKDPTVAYENSITRAQEEKKTAPSAFYPTFNIATAKYHLGKYDETIANYEAVASQLPPRMLWYQLEPILAYQKQGMDETVLQLTDRILNNGNPAYSELYQMRGEVYQKQGNREAARDAFEKARYYNKNYLPAQQALAELGS